MDYRVQGQTIYRSIVALNATFCQQPPFLDVQDHIGGCMVHSIFFLTPGPNCRVTSLYDPLITP
jgi:hypothetical protein